MARTGQKQTLRYITPKESKEMLDLGNFDLDKHRERAWEEDCMVVRSSFDLMGAPPGLIGLSVYTDGSRSDGKTGCEMISYSDSTVITDAICRIDDYA